MASHGYPIITRELGSSPWDSCARGNGTHCGLDLPATEESDGEHRLVITSARQKTSSFWLCEINMVVPAGRMHSKPKQSFAREGGSAAFVLLL